MKAIILTGKNTLEIRNVPKPENALPGHLKIKMHASGINSGDKLFISGAFPRGIPVSKYAIAGVSGVGTVIEVGKGVPDYYNGKIVTVYRSLRNSDNTIGTWSEYSHLHYLNCAIVKQDLAIDLYAGALVNIITPFAFLKHVISEGHKAIICTAGNSATGIAMLGLSLHNNFPMISIVRSEEGQRKLKSLGAKYVAVQKDPGFREQVRDIAQRLDATAIFDGVGGKTLSGIINLIPFNSVIYCYGFLDGQTDVTFSTQLLMKGITIKGFSNFRTATVSDSKTLEQALNDISGILYMPHFQAQPGKTFYFEEVNDALDYSSRNGKAILIN